MHRQFAVHTTRPICVGLLALLGCSGETAGQVDGATPPTVIKLSPILNRQSDWYAGAKRFEELAEAATDGPVGHRMLDLLPENELAGPWPTGRTASVH